MTSIKFYVTPDGTQDISLLTACRLAEKTCQQHQKAYIHTNSAEQSTQLDTLLWTFSDGSFIPHALSTDAHADDSTIVIGHDIDAPECDQVLINLAGDVPTFFSRFQRVAEIVGNSTDQKNQGRERYRFYQQRGYQLETHKL